MKPIVCAIQGENKTGKSSFALTFPKKIFYIGIDIGGFERAARRFKTECEAGQIVCKEYPLPEQNIRDQILGKMAMRKQPRITGVRELWYQMVTDYYVALEDNECNTIIVDPATQLNELCAKAYLQEIQENQPSYEKPREKLGEFEYGERNSRMRAFIQAAKVAKKSLVLIHYLTDTRETKLIDGKAVDIVTGHDMAGWKYTGDVVDIICQTNLIKSNGQTIPELEITKSGLGLDILGMKIQKPTYDMLATFIDNQ